MKNMKKFVSIMLTVAMLATMCSVVLANPISDGKITGNVNGKIDSGLTNTANTIIGYIQFVGYAIAVGMLIYIGIKYMMSSAADKADLKKGAINYVIGAILVAGAVTIAGFLANIGDGIGK